MTDSNPIFTIRTPEQLKAISDPFRQRLMGRFAEPATAKQAAEQLGVPVSRLYHHLDQLESAGLLTVVAETKRRGAMERTFQAAAQRIAVASSALSDAGSGPAHPRAAMAHLAVDAIVGAMPAEAAPASALHLAQTQLKMTADGLAAMEAELGTFLKRFTSEEGGPVNILVLAAPGTERGA
jgi:DNA-binding transcriptional ArsR family regulator